MSEILLYDATTIATCHNLSEIEYELKRRYMIRENISSTLYTCSEDALEMAVKIYNEPSIRAEREAILRFCAEIKKDKR